MLMVFRLRQCLAVDLQRPWRIALAAERRREAIVAIAWHPRLKTGGSACARATSWKSVVQLELCIFKAGAAGDHQRPSPPLGWR